MPPREKATNTLYWVEDVLPFSELHDKHYIVIAKNALITTYYDANVVVDYQDTPLHGENLTNIPYRTLTKAQARQFDEQQLSLVDVLLRTPDQQVFLQHPHRRHPTLVTTDDHGILRLDERCYYVVQSSFLERNLRDGSRLQELFATYATYATQHDRAAHARTGIPR
ncbi:hypothetical protein GF367_01660 [Candidatus Woesearchaeota archaeon]|nr:hypothetical protein [Candidatus Woesearchaeota archaeon]